MKELEANKKDEVAESAIEQLIVAQDVRPITDLDQLAALWPADDDPDALMNYVLSERQARILLHTEDHQSK
ncbi:MAG TPA: hypothetical protein VIW64_14980 [Pyrinomonadaceae bacterium]|jgi:hypothetical protein